MMKSPVYQTCKAAALAAALLIAAAGESGARTVKTIASNPYQHVNWQSCGRHKANLHTHTTESDGRLSPSAVIDRYQAMGYTVLALTDHNEYSWPWSRWDRDPSQLGMVAIDGCEASRHDHLNSFFCDYDGSSGDIETSLSQIAQKGGLAQINHPGRYSRSVSWYKDLYDSYEGLFGMEVYNQGDRYDNDRRLWDSILTVTMPNRPVWAASCDDMHKESHLFRNWQVLLTSGPLSDTAVRDALVGGWFYVCYDPSGDQSDAVALDSLTVSGDTVRVFADCDPANIHWISDAAYVHQGAFLCLNEMQTLGSYVRVEIQGQDGARTLTQPLGLKEISTSSIPASGRPHTSFAARFDRGLLHLTSDYAHNARAAVFTLSGKKVASGSITAHLPLPVSRAVASAPHIVKLDIAGASSMQRLVIQ